MFADVEHMSYMRTYIDSEYSETTFRRHPGLRVRTPMLANIIYRVSSALNEALHLSLDVLFLSQTQQC